MEVLPLYEFFPKAAGGELHTGNCRDTVGTHNTNKQSVPCSEPCSQRSKGPVVAMWVCLQRAHDFAQISPALYRVLTWPGYITPVGKVLLGPRKTGRSHGTRAAYQ